MKEGSVEGKWAGNIFKPLFQRLGNWSSPQSKSGPLGSTGGWELFYKKYFRQPDLPGCHFGRVKGQGFNLILLSGWFSKKSGF